MARHELLASRVVSRDGSLYLEQASDWTISEGSRENLSSAAAEPPSAQLQRMIDSLVWTPLAHGKVFRPFVLELSAVEAVCGFVLHHRVVDYYGLQILAAEIRAELCGEAGKAAGSDPKRLQYSDYLRGMAAWEAGAEAQQRLERWREAMRGAPPTCLPDAAEVDGTQVGPMDCVELALSPTLRARLAAAARSCRSPLSAVFMAAHHIALAGTLDQSDVVATVIVSGRDAAALLDIVGNLTDCLPLRASVSRRALFPAFVQQMHETFVRGYRHRLKWELIRGAMQEVRASVIAPTFNFVMSAEDSPAPDRGDDGKSDLTLETLDVDLPPVRGSAGFHMSHHMGLWDTGEQIFGRVAYTPMRYGKAAVAAFVGRFLGCLTAVADDPFIPVGRTMDG